MLMAKMCKYMYIDDSESIMPQNRFISRKMTSLPHPLLFIQTSYINKKVNLFKKSRRWGVKHFRENTLGKVHCLTSSDY